ncbi:hypothetical protein A2V56_02355 [Candidatus Woesebacteria bacterium RBG_19FT_COMBO_42_9]|uniref:Tyrosine specific protein phosphatases domain-containing protein n=1 Tax=Candidatus Woesebacteria bacterium RBG_16_42_24 TaxID=1802485 RepID=A0A1F7XL12_9BACT|nr:MAG: hypothetical protein A2V97_03175 [Candidatus Woesebacteria bacterium RBG_16_42_24]OGM16964.1 MAG: hypothetical protein A2V56_02355 [Candidatus Woesebacteria bacterium RBG_19FT_COMBO_42_9]OGM68460.1 MAG: hypothetical protein A2985_01530 [Candidatus Woesebacteria bacterium RIFCSPLOWO2_01_FULL_43_11]
MNDDHLFDYSKITDNIYIGSDLCKGNICPVHSEQFRQLKVWAELNLTAEHKETPPDEIEFYAWMPIVDHRAPSPDQFEAGTYLIDHIVRKGKTIYVHCKVGHGRSPTMVAAYLIRYKGMVVDEAISFVSSQRPGVRLEDVQKQALEQFYKKWSK